MIHTHAETKEALRTAKTNGKVGIAFVPSPGGFHAFAFRRQVMQCIAQGKAPLRATVRCGVPYMYVGRLVNIYHRTSRIKQECSCVSGFSGFLGFIWCAPVQTQEFVTAQSQQFLERVAETSGVGKATGLPKGARRITLPLTFDIF